MAMAFAEMIAQARRERDTESERKKTHPQLPHVSSLARVFQAVKPGGAAGLCVALARRCHRAHCGTEAQKTAREEEAGKLGN